MLRVLVKTPNLSLKELARTPASQTGKVPDFASGMMDSDMSGLGPGGKPTGQRATFTGASKVQCYGRRGYAAQDEAHH